MEHSNDFWKIVTKWKHPNSHSSHDALSKLVYKQSVGVSSKTVQTEVCFSNNTGINTHINLLEWL